MCTPKLEGKRGKLVYLLEENQNGFFSKSFWPIIVWQLFYFGCKKGIFLREIGQCFGELYLKKGYVLFKYINLFFLSMWDQTWLLFIFFFIIIHFFLWYQKRAGLLNDDDFFFSNHFSFHIFTTVFFSGSDRVFFLAVWNFNSFNFNQFHFLVFVFLEWYNHYLQSYVQQRSWMPWDGEMHY